MRFSFNCGMCGRRHDAMIAVLAGVPPVSGTCLPMTASLTWDTAADPPTVTVSLTETQWWKGGAAAEAYLRSVGCAPA